MASQFSGAPTLSNDLQYYDDSGPKTPEPPTPGISQRSLPPLPPLRPRLKLKRRHVAQRNAPTQHFLASIAAADVPIPSVEGVDQKMMATLPEFRVDDFDNTGDCPPLNPRIFSPPKTPAIDIAPSVAQARYPDWYCDDSWSDSDSESNLDYDESSRPSTALSTQTSASLFSLYSSTTDNGSCISLDLEATEISKKSESESAPLHSVQDKPRRAPWTRAMSAHLWATYMLYLSDPRVTPIYLGKSCIPPHGVCARVARQAQRSWKGSKSQSTNDMRSRSSTPTAQSAKTYIQWPHTGGATRAHLRELCKIKAANKPRRYVSRSPAPFNKVANRRWNRRSTPARDPSAFSAQDMAMSLALSTSEAMQPNGPLAQLTRSQPPPETEYELQSGTIPSHAPYQQEPVAKTPVEAQLLECPFIETGTRLPCDSPGRLGSPFLAKSYGPSSSSIVDKVTLPKQPNTVGPRKLLKSPARLNRSRSGAQKRRSAKGHEEKPWKRPSLAAAFFREGSRNAESPKRVSNANTPSTQGRLERDDDPFIAASSLPNNASTTDSLLAVSALSPQSSPSRPPRLGSPFSAGSSSYSFPNRLTSSSSFGLSVLRKPFATIQQAPQSTQDTQTPIRSGLSSRLAYLDQRLKELRNRGADRRRSQSPM